MRKTASLLAFAMIAAALAVYTPGPAAAEPGKNKITVEGASCSDGVTRTLIVNAMGKAVKLPDSNSNFVVKRSTFAYSDPETGVVLAVEEYGKDKSKGFQDDLVTCEGRTTTEIVNFGLVTIDYEAEGFFTPRGKA